MSTVDISITGQEIFRTMIGRPFMKYKCDPFVFSPSVYGIVGFYIGEDVFKMTALHKTVSRFFENDDVTVLQLEIATDKDIVTMMDEGQMIETPVKDVIRSIDIIKDHETVSHQNDDRTLISTKGIIFHLEGGNEISFEIGTWFSEFITVRKGYDLIQKFKKTQDFLEEWEGNQSYMASVWREIITIS